MLELKNFQADAAKSIANRYSFFANHTARPRKGDKPRPFFQALSALTGAGKTPILAQSVTLMRAHFTCEPIVFWMSKAKSVVAQTYTNFSSGGKYSEIIEGFEVINITQLSPELIADSTTPLLIMATTGLFNNKDQSEGALNIYKRDEDAFGKQSPWERLIQRTDNGKRRPLLIVYDEGHNLSEQQTELLAELEPDAYLLASATLKLPTSFNTSIIQHIRLWIEDAINEIDSFKMLGALDDAKRPDLERFITTAVISEQVVDAELVKKAIHFDGTTAAMERCLDELIKRLGILQEEIDALGLKFKPKGIYVCKTNMTDEGDKDDHTKPFAHRKARPIRIWRYLVEEKKIDPKSIAIYANLDFVNGNKPEEVNLFSKGDTDFDDFRAGNFQHIIFNQSLQEGWDDPACYLAYIDKSMGSSIQVEQVIGRALRQFGAKHYSNPLLNSAHFFIRVDKQSVFTESIKAVKAKLQMEGAPIEVIDNYGGSGIGADDLKPKPDFDCPLCWINVDADAARERIDEILSEFTTYTENSADTAGQAHTAKQIVDLKSLGKDSVGPQWNPDGNTNAVRLRWLLNSALRARSSRALAITDLRNIKFDVRAQIQSNANKAVEKLADSIVEVYYQHAELIYEKMQPYRFGTIRAPKNAPSFTNGLYDRYSGFNKFESSFSIALDASGYKWHRNQSSGGFHIPLLSPGETASFFPDFIVWKSGLIYCLDTKGSHLLSDAVARKLFDIHDGDKIKLHVRLISQGKQTELRGKSIAGGFTVWKSKQGKPIPVHVDSIEKAVKECIK